MSSIRWTSHLPKADKESFEQSLAQAETVLKRLRQLIEEDYNISDKEMHKRDNFFMPAWAEKQAFELGIQKALKTIMKLTEV